MAYEPYEWVNDVTDITAERMNHIEQGVKAVENEKADKSEIPDISGKADKSYVDEELSKRAYQSSVAYLLNEVEKKQEKIDGLDFSVFGNKDVMIGINSDIDSVNFDYEKRTFFKGNVDVAGELYSNDAFIGNQFDEAGVEIDGLNGDVKLHDDGGNIIHKLSEKANQSIINNAINEGFLFSRNLFSSGNARKGYYLDSRGNLNTNVDWNISDYIKVEGGNTYTLSGGTETGTSPSVCWYDTNKAYISGQSYQNNPSVTITLPAQARYIRFTYSDSTAGTFVINEGREAIPYQMPTKSNVELTQESYDLKMLGWNTPKECPIQNTVSGNQFIQRVGRVDMGSLSWTYSGSYFYINNLTYIKPPTDNNTPAKMYTTVYNTSYWNDVSDKVITFSSASAGYRLGVNDSSYTSVTSFKNSLADKYLYYELANPITMNIDGNEANTSNVYGTSDQWSSKSSWTAGEMCIDSNKLWKCLINNSNKPSEGSEWTQVSLKNVATQTTSTINFDTNYINSLAINNVAKQGNLAIMSITGYSKAIIKGASPIVGTFKSGFIPIDKFNSLITCDNGSTVVVEIANNYIRFAPISGNLPEGTVFRALIPYVTL